MLAPVAAWSLLVIAPSSLVTGARVLRTHAAVEVQVTVVPDRKLVDWGEKGRYGNLEVHFAVSSAEPAHTASADPNYLEQAVFVGSVEDTRRGVGSREGAIPGHGYRR